jgi:iron complex transport system substrate-binding protein
MTLPGNKKSIIFIMLFLLGACSPATTPTTAPTETASPKDIQLVDSAGRTINLASPAQRIVSLSPAITESLFALGASDQIVGRDTLSDFPEQAKSIIEVGGGFGELNIEAILSQAPDLVLVSALTPPEQSQALQDAGLTVFTMGNPKNFDGLYGDLITLAKLSGHETAADQLIAGLKQRVATVQAKLSQVNQRPLVFYEIDATDPNAVWTAGPGSIIDTLITMAGGKNLGATLADEWVQISLEELISRDPDLILLGDAYWGGVTVESVGNRSGWQTLKAVQNAKVYPFDDNLISRPGPRLVDGLETLAQLLHPELAQ